MSKDVLSEYYKGIHGKIASEVLHINSTFEHQGLKGSGNEEVIKKLLLQFIPKKYGVSSGIVIDKSGNQSKQCDIIIYDRHNYPELLSMSDSKMFPVDIVYAVIEVKTKLDSDKSKIALENVDSVLNLDFIKERFRMVPTEPIGEINSNTTLFEDVHTTPPLGLIFSYESSTNKFETFHGWFKKGNHDKLKTASHVCCLDQGMLLLRPADRKEEIPLIFPIVEGDIFQTADDIIPTQINGNEYFPYKDHLYPYTEADNTKVLVDQAKTLLNFILILTGMLDRKFLSPRINFMNHYFSDDLKTKFTVIDGKINVIK